MDERHLETVQAGTRLSVDELYAHTVEPGELGAKIIDLVGDVVHARPTAGEEPSDRRVLLERREQLDPTVTDVKRGRLRALTRDRPLPSTLAEQALVRRDGLVEIGTATPMWWMPPSATSSDASQTAGQSATGRTRTVPTVSGACDSRGTPPSSSSSWSRTSVSRSSSACAIRSSGARYFVSSRMASS